MAVTSSISVTRVGTGRNKRSLYTATKVVGPTGSPPEYITQIIRYDDAKGENERIIGTTSSNDPGKVIWTENATRLVKVNEEKIKKTSANQVKSIQNEVASNAQEKEVLNSASGANNQANSGDDQQGDSSKPSSSGASDTGAQDGTREEEFGFYVFPESLRTGQKGQDFLKIDMMKYQPRQLGAQEEGVGSSLTINDREQNRKSIGTVILPIPGGIQDSQQVQWGSDSMTPMQIAMSNVALAGITQGMGAMVDAGGNALTEATASGEDVKKALANTLAGQAAGAGKLLTRTTGAVMNPNMELLFNSPNMRNFSFQFRLAPRSKSEAMTIIKIIRFFKQGMSAIRSKSRLFLKSPHTFRLAYKHKAAEGAGFGKNDHPYLNKFKECALGGFTVNYTPDGQYATYEDGVMASYQISMNFQEMEPVYNDDYGNNTFPSEIGF
tara:strand:- start:681 stop:1997 length:1317 start_codon:yes stop_codon:yes gene_type:complete